MIVPASGDRRPEPSMGVSLASWELGPRGVGLVSAGRVLLVALGTLYRRGPGWPRVCHLQPARSL